MRGKIYKSKNGTATNQTFIMLLNDNNNYEKTIEKTLHRLFLHKKINREWFRLDLEDVQNFRSICQKIENNLNLISQNEKLG